jgi:hypothetical protein
MAPGRAACVGEMPFDFVPRSNKSALGFGKCRREAESSWLRDHNSPGLFVLKAWPRMSWLRLLFVMYLFWHHDLFFVNSRFTINFNVGFLTLLS